ncbi:MAG: hypothetical protein ABSF28_00045 [Terracidiphilus sp.]
MTRLACCGTVVLLLNLSACSIETVLHGLSTVQTQQPAQTDPTPQPALVAQTTPPAKPAHKAKKPDPKPEPTEQDLLDYLRAKLLSLSPEDGLNDNLEVSYDLATSIMSITQPDGHCDISWNAIDANSALWDTIDPSDTYHKRDEVLRLTLTSQNGKSARVCYDRKNQINPNAAANRVRLLFSHPKADGISGFMDTMDKAVKKLVALSGGTPEKKIL